MLWSSACKFQSLYVIPSLLPFLLLFSFGASDNHPPVAVDDSFTVHGCTTVNVTSNDSDPDNNPISVNGFPTLPAHAGIFSNNGNGNIFYCPNNGYVGSDSFVYQLCDSQHACANATVTLNVANQAPNGVADFYDVHGFTVIGPFLANDSDPDGDSFTCGAIGHNCIQTFPQHGTLNGISTDHWAYTPAFAYTGPDSLTYNVCDGLGLCSETTVNLSVNNNSPIVLPDIYLVPGPFTPIGPFMRLDFDPDNDTLRDPEFFSFPQHGTLFPSTQRDKKSYTANPGFSGLDSFTYRVCDSLGGCSPVIGVYLIVLGNDDGLNNGVTSCNSNRGGPVNVTNGNMYLQQHDYALPGVGYGIDLNRTYNSNSQKVGLFGRGWSTAYDATITLDSDNLAHLMQADGRVIYFWRSDINGPFVDLIGDLHQQLTQTGSSFTLTMKDGSAEQFNSAGRLLSLTDRNGNTTSLSYDVNGSLAGIADPAGRTLTVNVNANGRIITAADSLGAVATYTYGGSNELLSVIYADNSAYNFVYDGGLRLTTVTDALANVVESHNYDSQGRATTSERQGGVDHYSFNYLSDSETDVTDGLGRVTKYTIDKTKGRNVVTRVEGLCGCGGGNNSQVQTWTYDNQLNVTAKSDALDHTTTYSYDSSGNRLTQTDPTGTITYSYNGFGEVLTRRDQMDGTTTNTFDGLGNLVATKDALDNTTTFTYNARGQMLSATDARQKPTTFTYDASGNLTQRRDANNITTFFFYDARSRLTKVRDGLSRSTLFAYDPFGRINKVTHPDNSFVMFTYDLAGRRTVVTDERGNPTNYAYDGAYRLTSVTDALSHANAYDYDSMSNLTSVSDALSRTTNYNYDAFDRLVKITYSPASAGATRLFETIAYDGDGNVTSRTDTASRTTSYGYDNVNRVTSTTDAAHEPTAFAYDALGRVTSLTDAINQQYQFGYDALGRQTSITRGGTTMSYVYDEVGNRTQRTDYNGVVTNYAYDNLNRLTTITYPTRTVTYGYDPLNNVTRATNENGTVYIGYDNRYRVTSFSDPFYYGISYNYDTVGNRTALKVNGATYASYTYDAANRLTTLKDSANLAFNYTYDAANRLTNRSAPNGVNSSYAYDDLDRLTTLMHTVGATTLSGNVYTFNHANNIASWTTSTAQRAFSYDAIDRLTSVTNFESPTESYTYDDVGNRTASHLSATYSYQPVNRLANTASATYTYDYNGNRTAKTDFAGTTTFSYSEENQLTRAALPNGLTIDYKYDALGRRIQRTASNGGNERYIYDQDDVLVDLNADWSVATTYLNDQGIDNHLRQTNSLTGVSYFLTDHIGSTSALTDASGGLVEQLTYDSFGNGGTSARTRYTYTGRERDAETGLFYYRARYYDPQIGRFTSEDPIGAAGGINQFAYVRNNPQNAKDPFGLYEKDVHYYLTYYLALRTKCFTDAEAREIANGDQGVDEDPATSPWFGGDERQRQVNTFYHGLHPGSHQPYLDAHWMDATMGRGNPSALGIYLHYLQDTFSHAGYTDPVCGHGCSVQNYPDKTENNTEQAQRMVAATWDALNRFAREKHCGCEGRWDPSWWPIINDFLGAPSGNRFRDISDTELERKRLILGVGPR